MRSITRLIPTDLLWLVAISYALTVGWPGLVIVLALVVWRGPR